MKYLALLKNRELTVILILTFFASNPCLAAVSDIEFKNVLSAEEVQAMEEEGSLDDSSEQCMSCHNGSRGRKIVRKSAEAPMHFEGHMNTNHPVGMNYRNHAANDPQGYKPLETLDKAILLVNGKVACISCHMLKKDMQVTSTGFIKVGLSRDGTDPFCTLTKQLTRVTDLCMSCHIK
jgi:hypothetical protein